MMPPFAFGRSLAAAALLAAGLNQGPAARPGGDSTSRRALEVRAGELRIEDLRTLEDVNRQLDALRDVGADVASVVRRTPLVVGDVTVRSGERVAGDLVVFRGTADVFGDVGGSVVALFGNVILHRGGAVEGDAVSFGGQVVDSGGTVRGEIKTVSQARLQEAASIESRVTRKAATVRRRTGFEAVFEDVRNVVAVFVAFAMLGFGTAFFARRHLEVVADTAQHAFFRSLVAGLLGQLLLFPTLAMLVVGLVCTIVGILLLPFAAVAYFAAVCVALVGGYLAVAHAVGETVARRRMAQGAFVRVPNAYGYVFNGLVGLLGLWAAAALTGWMGPVVLLFKVTAVMVTWLAATVGFGAVLLSRGGLRETFAGRHGGELSGEYMWPTPPASPTAGPMRRERE